MCQIWNMLWKVPRKKKPFHFHCPIGPLFHFNQTNTIKPLWYERAPGISELELTEDKKKNKQRTKCLKKFSGILINCFHYVLSNFLTFCFHIQCSGLFLIITASRKLSFWQVLFLTYSVCEKSSLFTLNRWYPGWSSTHSGAPTKSFSKIISKCAFIFSCLIIWMVNVGIKGKAITRVNGHESRLYKAPWVIVGLFYKFTFCKGERTKIKTHRHPNVGAPKISEWNYKQAERIGKFSTSYWHVQTESHIFHI